MQCPVDGATLVMAERSGVEIDYCPKCRGVWLDRGELDKIIDRAASPAPAPEPAPRAPEAPVSYTHLDVYKRQVLQHLMFLEEGVQLGRHLGARGARHQQADAQLMRRHVDIPDPAAGGINLAHEHRAFQCGVIARNHREGVQGQDIATLQLCLLYTSRCV